MNKNNTRIAKNTIVLYLRMFFVLGLGLVSSRYILEALGIEDYGVYNVVAGVVTLFSFISVSMNSASSRFLTTSIGKNDIKSIKETFKAACTVHILIAIILTIIAETIGLWIVSCKLVIPITQHLSAVIIYQLAIAISIISVIQTPFSASLIAYEQMGAYAGVEILNVCLKFLAVIFLFVIPTNRLVIYVTILFVISIIVFLSYVLICKKKFPFLEFGLNKDKNQLTPMLSFSGWDLYGNMSVAARTQGVNILLNLFFGPILNAASGLAGQVQNAVVSLSSNVVMAAKPQIIKSYASGEIYRCISLIIIISKLTTALLLIVCVPLVINIDYILKIWLKEVPEFTGYFSIWCLLFALVANLSTVIMSAIHATGKIKKSSLWNGTIYLLVIPLTYICFKFQGSPGIPFIINTIAVVIGLSLNIYYLTKYISEFNSKRYITSAIIPILFMTIFAFGIALFLSTLIFNPLVKLFLIIIVNIIFLFIFSFTVLLSKDQRESVLQIIKNYGK